MRRDREPHRAQRTRRGSSARWLAVAVGIVGVGIAVAAGVYFGGSNSGGVRSATPRGTNPVRRVPGGSSRALAGKVRMPSGKRVLWGLYVPGAPYDRSKLVAVERAVGRRPAIVMWYQEWAGKRPFPAGDAGWLLSHGIVPMATWEPWRPPKILHQLVGNQRRFRLARIAAGAFDSYIRSYAEQIKGYGGPVMLRPFHEMDGFWYPWGGTVNGNSPAAFVAAWRHIHHIFDQVGATNVTWVWSVNHESVPATRANDATRYWPGSRYVDWIGISGFNWGTSSPHSAWDSFDELYEKRISLLMQFRKPIVLTEIGAAEVGGDKAAWIRRTFATILRRYPRVRAFVWYDGRDSKLQDWRITSSPASLAAFRATVR